MLVTGSSGIEHYLGDDNATEEGMGLPDDPRLLNARMRTKDCLDLLGVYLVAAAVDDALCSATVREQSLLVLGNDVARAEPIPLRY